MSELTLSKERTKARQQSVAARLLPAERLERVSSWGEVSSSMSYVYRPSTIEALREVLQLAKQSSRSIGLRGGGNSYGDAAMNTENIVIDFRRMNRILEWDPETGRVRVEPGVTLSELWQYTLEDGWWPAIATGTSLTTMGGCAAMNVHGKNAWRVGTFGDHVTEFDFMLASGEIVTCSRDENSDLFHAAIGGFGMLGVFTSLTLKLKPIYSGLLDVETGPRANFDEMFAYFEQHVDSSDYVVGWIDAMAAGEHLGRGDVHRASYLPPGADAQAAQTMRLEKQHLGPNLFGVVPRSVMWLFMKPMIHNPGVRFVNFGKVTAGHLSGFKQFRQPHAQFHFLLDYVPDWKNAYLPEGLIQYQPFIPRENAHQAFADILSLCQRRDLPNYLTVLKRHRPDDFLISYGVDGYSMAMDFRVTNSNRRRIAWLAQELDEIVLAAGGRFYLAKDSTLRPEVARAYLGEETLTAFRKLKERCDPESLFQTDLWRRVFA